MTPRAAHPSDTGPLSREQMRTLLLTSLGGALELFDFVIFVFFVPVLALAFFPPGIPSWLAELQTFVVFAVGYFARPFGGVVIAHFGDRLGRKRTFAFTVTLMAGATLGMAVLPGYATIGMAAPLLLCGLRIVQGIAVGGEVAGGYLFGAEHVADARRGRACGFVASGMTCGVLLGVSVSALLHQVLSEPAIQAYGWRLPFALGGLLGFLALFLRRHLHETPVFAALQAAGGTAPALPIGEVLRAHPRAVAVSVGAFWSFIAHFVVLCLMGPTLLQTLFHLSAVEALTAGCLATGAFVVFAQVSGHLFDAIGQARALVLASLIALCADAAFFLGATARPDLAVPFFILAGAGGGMLGAASVVMIRAFPPRIAYSGVSLSLNLVSGIIAGATPVLISGVLPWLPSAPLWYLAAACLTATSVGLGLLHRARAH
ncbi:MFS transporter [Aquabacter cavernae]|uniref:MFS transporter n=1 Tax=Aquabacter cavernae TaxID=2496029 RepID=UPI000F8E43B0|nr:MFS transporter [Aquabacter cavernae]